MKVSKKGVIGTVIGVILVVAAGVGVWYLTTDNFKYRGLNQADEPEMTDEQRTYFEQQMRTAQASLDIQKASMDIQDVDWDLYLSVAWNAAAVGELVTARETLEEYLELTDRNAGAYSLYGSVLTRMGDYDRAEDAFAMSAQVDPTEEGYRKWIFGVRNNPPDGSREDEVKDILDNAVDTVGQRSWFMNELAIWYLEHDECDQAIAHYEVAQDLLPEGNEAIAVDLAAARTQCKNK